MRIPWFSTSSPEHASAAADGVSDVASDTPSDAATQPSPKTSASGGDGSAAFSRYFQGGPYPDGALQSERRKSVLLLTLCMIFGVATFALTVATIYLSTTSRVEPFYVAVDRQSGDVVDARPVSTTKYLSERMIRSRLRKVVEGLRTVYTDKRATRRSYEEAWRYVLPGSSADRFLRDFLSTAGTDNPVQLVGEQQRFITDIEVTHVQGTRTYQVTWAERHINSKSDIRETLFTGSLSTVRIDLNDTDALRLNPIGLFVDGISFRKTDSRILQTGGDS